MRLTGSLNTETAPELERQLAVALADPIKDAVFDLGELNFVTSAGLRIFAAARKKLTERGGQTSFVNLQPQIEAVFDVIKSLPGVSLYQSSADLDRYLALLQCDEKGNGGS